MTCDPLTGPARRWARPTECALAERLGLVPARAAADGGAAHGSGASAQDAPLGRGDGGAVSGPEPDPSGGASAALGTGAGALGAGARPGAHSPVGPGALAGGTVPRQPGRQADARDAGGSGAPAGAEDVMGAGERSAAEPSSSGSRGGPQEPAAAGVPDRFRPQPRRITQARGPCRPYPVHGLHASMPASRPLISHTWLIHGCMDFNHSETASTLQWQGVLAITE